MGVTMSEEWGPWIEHDGKGCPCIGMYVHLEAFGFGDGFCVAGEQCLSNGVDPNGPLSAWVWILGNRPIFQEVIRYRIRKPRGLTILEGLLENLPEQVDA